MEKTKRRTAYGGQGLFLLMPGKSLEKKHTFWHWFLLLAFIFPFCGDEKCEKTVKPHILLITIDTLRRDHLSCYGYSRETSPFIDRLAREGLRFEHVVTPIPSTSGSHASILTSLHPLTHGITSIAAPLSLKTQTMAEVLKENGYYTIGAVAVKILGRKYNFSQGFDSYSDQWDENKKFNKPYDRDAKSVNESVFKQIDEYLLNHKNIDKPLFIWVHYFDPHFPYLERESITFKNKLKERENNKSIKRYDKEIRYTDEHIKKLYKYLEDKGLAQHLVTCITADHGEHFFEHGLAYCHADFYSETTLVPLIFHGCGISKNVVIKKYVSTMDIAVTLLGMAGLNFLYPTEGKNLLKSDEKKTPPRDKKLLVVGDPISSKSLQLLGYPFDYILNFDHHYKNWFISGKHDFSVDEDRFLLCHKRQIKTKNNIKKITLPSILEEGLNYIIFRAEIKRNKGLSAMIKLLPYSMTRKVGVSKEIKQLNIVYPVTIGDRIIVNLYLKEGTIIDETKYAVISKKEFPHDTLFKQKIKNVNFEKLSHQRKGKTNDEFFDLSNDIKMEKDLIREKKFKHSILEYRKLIYAAFRYYYQKKNTLLKGSKKRKQLSEEEKKMLKSLGYL